MAEDKHWHFVSTTYKFSSNGENYTTSWDSLKGFFDVIFLDEGAQELREEFLQVVDTLKPAGVMYIIGS